MMDRQYIKDIIRNKRIELEISQEELCEGICDQKTLSRFENGITAMSYSKLEKIMQRLGIPDSRHYLILGNDNTDVDELSKKIISCNVRFERASNEERAKVREQALRLHRELESIITKGDMSSRQLIIGSLITVGKEDGPYSTEERLDLLFGAIRLTRPKFDIDNILKFCYTETELKIINQIATTYARAEQHDKCLDILRGLYKYVQNPKRGLPYIATCAPLICFNLSRELSEIGSYDEALDILKCGKDLCIEHKPSRSLPALIAVEADCYFHKGEIEKSRRLFRQAYYMSEALRDEHNRIQIQKDASELVGLTLPD